MKKILICLLSISFFMNTHQSVNAMKRHEHQQDVSKVQEVYNNGKPLEYEIDLLDYQGDTCSLPFTATSITEKAKKLGSKALPVAKKIAPWVILPSLYILYKYTTSTACDPDAMDNCDSELEFSLSNTITSAYSIISSPLGAVVFGPVITNKFRELKQDYFPMFLQSKDFATILEYKQKVDENFKNGKITENTKKKFDLEFDMYKQRIEWGDEKSEYTKEIIDNMEKISLLASDFKKLKHTDIDPRLLKMLETYPDETKKTMIGYIKRIISESNAKPPHKKIIMCFYGPPGTGKTLLAQEIAKIIGVSVVCFKASSNKAEEMIAQHFKKHQKEIMLELFTQKEKNYKKNILFIDEFNTSLEDSNESKGIFRKFYTDSLEREQRIYESGKIEGVDIDMSGAIIILACNELPKDGAILERMPVIKFEAIPKDKQFIIAQDSFEKELDRRNLYLEISEEHKQILQQIVDKNLKPGVRVLKDVVDEYIEYLIEEGVEPFNIDAVYKKYDHSEKKIDDNAEKKDEPDTQMMLNALICELYAEYLKNKKINSKNEDELSLSVVLQDKDKIEIQNQSNFNDINDDAHRDN